MKKFILSAILCLLLIPFFGVSFQASALNIDSTDPLEDLKTDSTFDVSDYPLNPSDNNLYVITLYEWEYQAIYIYVYNPLGSSLVSYGMRMTMKTHLNDSYSRYNLERTSRTADNVFIKYKVSIGSTHFQELKAKRTYEITEIENKISATTANYKAHRVGKIFTVTGAEANNNFLTTVKDLEVVVLDPHYDSYTTAIQNEFTELNKPSFTVVNYVAFPIQKNYGDLVGINIIWDENHWNKYRLQIYGDTYEEYDPELDTLISTDQYNWTYTDKDKKDILSYTDMNGTLSAWLNYLNFFYWFFPSATSINDLKVIEKLENPTSDNLVVDETIAYYNANKTEDNDIYIIRFALTNFKRWVTGQSPLYYYYFDYVEINDIDILELTFSLDGTTYTLGVVADPGDIIPEDPNPTPVLPGTPGFANPFQWLIDFFNNLLAKLGSTLGGVVIAAVVIASVVGVGFALYGIFKLIGAIRDAFRKK
ncbi:hypothetical protein LJC17_01420 [Acholeplasma sp. OttesenSCG-928-E16]|nr:hypothetical protein [Acholeplasma sp. OttesenSCG-928-E16]